jgi:RNA polymerase sigma factor (sigma-70 family)
MGKEYRVDIKIRNNLLLSAIENAGFQSVAHFCKTANIQSTSVYGLVSLKESPLRQDGTFTLVAQKILDYLCALPEDLWTEEQLWNTLTINTGRVLLDKHQMSVLSYGGEEEVLNLEDVVYKKEIQEKVYEVLGSLTPQEEKIIELRFGLKGRHNYTLEETGALLDITDNRVRQIESKALRKLRHPSRMKMLGEEIPVQTEEKS